MAFIPSNLDPRFVTGSYSANRTNPMFNRLQQFVGNARIPSAFEADQRAAERAQGLQIFERQQAETERSNLAREGGFQDQIAILMDQLNLEREQFEGEFSLQKKRFGLEREKFAEFKETSDIEQEQSRKEFELKFENLEAFYKELMPRYDEMFQAIS